MKTLKHVKLKNGDDIVGFVEYIDEERFTIQDAITIVTDPYKGMYTKKWMYLTRNSEACIDLFDVLFVASASESAIDIYTETIYQENEEAFEGIANGTVH